MSTITPKHRFFYFYIVIQCLRYGTVCAVMCAFCFAAFDERPPVYAPCSGMYCHYAYSSGWPLVCSTWQVSEPISRFPTPESQRIESRRVYAALGCWGNLLSFIVIAGSSFFIAHYTLPKVRSLRYSLSTLFIAIVVGQRHFASMIASLSGGVS